MTEKSASLLLLSPPARVPLWGWLLALLLGMLWAGASLSYAPSGRINVLWLWLLWAGLPFLGSLASLGVLCFGRTKPWLFRWRERHLHWHPSAAERLGMMGVLQQLWLLAGLGILLGYLTLLLFTDLAFGWSSTLIEEPRRIADLARQLASPWQWFWPAAVPSVELVEATRYARIDPLAGQALWAGDWWRFLLASLLVYNLLPRLLLALAIAAVLGWRKRRELQVRAPNLAAESQRAQAAAEDVLAHWQAVPALNWEIADADQAPDAVLKLGSADWQADEAQLQAFLQNPPKQLRWQVNASRSPVAELADLMALARVAGVQQQALQPVVNAATDPLRHLASWRAFADKQQLVWLKDTV